MRTTIALSPKTRDRLLDLKRQWRLRTVEAVLERLLDGEPRGARALYLERRKAVDAVVRKRRLKGLTAFGSRARGDAKPDSDLDLTATMPAGADLVDAVHVQDDLAAAFGVRVHFTPRNGLDKRVRSRIDDEGVALAP